MPMFNGGMLLFIGLDVIYVVVLLLIVVVFNTILKRRWCHYGHYGTLVSCIWLLGRLYGRLDHVHSLLVVSRLAHVTTTPLFTSDTVIGGIPADNCMFSRQLAVKSA